MIDLTGAFNIFEAEDVLIRQVYASSDSCKDALFSYCAQIVSHFKRQTRAEYVKWLTERGFKAAGRHLDKLLKVDVVASLYARAYVAGSGTYSIRRKENN